MTSGHFWLIFLIGLTIFAIIVAILLAVSIPMVISFTGANLVYGNFSNFGVFQIIYTIIFIPVGIFTMLIWGSLYDAICIGKEEKKPSVDLSIVG
jgi:hypothetical protein